MGIRIFLCEFGQFIKLTESNLSRVAGLILFFISECDAHAIY